MTTATAATIAPAVAAQQEADVDSRLDAAQDARLQTDPGLRLDMRFVTRRSIPPLWRERTPAVATAATAAVVPDCATLLADAVRAKRANRVDLYEACMAQLVSFFTSPDAAPARSPAEVRRAFALNASDAFLVATRSDIERLAWLDSDKTWQACNETVDVDNMDLVLDGERAFEVAQRTQN